MDGAVLFLLLAFLAVPIVSLIMFIVGRIGTRFEWTGFGPSTLEADTGSGIKLRPAKTFWDWLELIGPWAVALAVAAFGPIVAEAQLEAQLAAEAQRTQETALQAYLDHMNQHLLENGLRKSAEGSEVRTLARAQTLTVLDGLDPSRRTHVLRFLIEAELVQRVDDKDPVVSLSQANLQGVELSGANLQGADLAMANLSEATLIDVDLSGTVLSAANLSSANLSTGSDASSGTDLTDADLRFANLRGADLRGAEGVTKEQLEDQAESLEGATMPNGEKYEE